MKRVSTAEELSSMRSDSRSLRVTVLLIGILLLLSGLAPLMVRAFAAPAESPQVTLNGTQTQPRAIEDATQQAVTKAYATAWGSMETALAANRADVLAQGFTGVALDRLTEQVKEQRATGITVKYVDNGHQLDATFYSPEGSAMELHDTAQLEMQVYSGGKLIHSENVTQKYVALLTVADDKWKVRSLESMP